MKLTVTRWKLVGEWPDGHEEVMRDDYHTAREAGCVRREIERSSNRYDDVNIKIQSYEIKVAK